jgi:hypothetical protein
MKTVDCRFRVFHPEFGLRDSFSTFREARLRALAQIDAKDLQIEDVMAHVGQTYLWAYLPEANGFRPIGPRKDDTP